jgi:DNA-binding PadR family transcriptional regulator
LGLLAAGERSGYDLAKMAEGSLAYLWTPSQSQIYKVLPRLAARGLARAREVEQRGRPDKARSQDHRERTRGSPHLARRRRG